MKLNEDFYIEDYCLIRTPAFPIESLIELNNLLEIYCHTQAGDIEISLRKIFANEHFQEAISIASKDLFRSMQSWMSEEYIDAKKKLRLLKALHKYFTRMCTRSTPFGLFSGNALLEISPGETRLKFANKKFTKKYRFDMSFIFELTRQLTEDKILQKYLTYTLNDSVYKSGSKFRYTEYELKQGRRSYSLTAINESKYITKVIELSKKGATYDTLFEYLKSSGADEESIANFISQLIKVQLLTTEFLPAVTDENFTEFLIHRLKHLPISADYVKNLESAFEKLNSTEKSLETIFNLNKLTEDIINKKGLETIQTDLFLNFESSHISSKIIKEIVDTSYELHMYSMPYTPANLLEFKKKFVGKYEEREIPLTQAIDPELGIGYGLAINGNIESMPLIENLTIYRESVEQSPVKNSAIKKMVFRKMIEYKSGKSEFISLSESDLQSLKEDAVHPSEGRRSAFIFGNIIAKNFAECDEGQYKFYYTENFTPSSSRLLTRFAFGNDELKEKLKVSIDKEQQVNPDTILAEVVYLPEGSFANLVLRPSFRKHEIHFLGRSSVESNYQINVNDLLISVKNDRIILRSKSLNKEILPQITNPFNPVMGQPLYRFLADMDIQGGRANFTWPWNDYNDEIFLPRVEYKKFIVSRARWFFRKKDVEKLSEQELSKYFLEMQEKYNIPKHVLLSHGGDNELFIDFNSTFGQYHLYQHIRKSDIVLYEALQLPKESFLQIGGESYINEIIIPIGTDKPILRPGVIRLPKAFKSQMTKRSFTPGTNWLYFKIYGGNKTLESILINQINDYCRSLLRNGSVNKWFFIRFNDPESHLRIRFHNDDPALLNTTVIPGLNKLLDPFIESEQLSKVSIDTYTRELERYGHDTIIESEYIFYNDSQATLDFLSNLNKDGYELRRWQGAIFSVNLLLDDFGYDLTGKSRIMSSLQKMFFKEFSTNKKDAISKLEHSLNDKYRIDYPVINEMLEYYYDNDKADEHLECFILRSEKNKPFVDVIKSTLSPNGAENDSLDALLQSYIHMNLNRIFLTRQRTHELVIYHYLDKYYKSQIAKNKTMKISDRIES